HLVTSAQVNALTRLDPTPRPLLAHINDILTITRIEAGRMPLNLPTSRVPDLVGEVMPELEPIIKRSNLAVAAKMPRQPPTLKSDRQKVKQIVLNLLSNALKFTPQGSVTIGAAYDPQSRTMSIAVSATVTGIQRADINKD